VYYAEGQRKGRCPGSRFAHPASSAVSIHRYHWRRWGCWDVVEHHRPASPRV